MAATAATNDALIKFSFCSGGKSQLRRTRVPSLEALNFTLLQDLASEVFPEAPKGRLEFSYEDDEGEKVNISNDRDYAECCQVMDTVNKKALRIELTICEEERDERASRPRAAMTVETRGIVEAKSGEPSPRSRDSSSSAGGHCTFCGDEVAQGIRFCSDDCASAAEAFNATVPPTPSAAARDPSSSSKSLLLRSRVNSQDNLSALAERFDALPLGGSVDPRSSGFGGVLFPTALESLTDASSRPSRRHTDHGQGFFSVLSRSGSSSGGSLAGMAAAGGSAGFGSSLSSSALTSTSMSFVASSASASAVAKPQSLRPVFSFGSGAGGPPGLGGLGLIVGGGDDSAASSRASTPSLLSAPSPSELPLSEPSACIPWVSPEVSRELVTCTFEQFGVIRQVDLVPREDHFLCFVHFHSWKIDDPSVNCLRNRLLNPPSFEHKESVDYIHPVSGPQRWLFSRSRVPPRPQKTSSSRASLGGPVPLSSSAPGTATRSSTGSLSAPTAPSPVPTAFVPINEPSLCVPWVRQNVTRELLQETFSPFGSVRQVDLVPKGDHFLCFVHFHAWKLDNPAAVALRARLLNPPSADHKESVYYTHPTLGRQRWLFARSWVSPTLGGAGSKTIDTGMMKSSGAAAGMFYSASGFGGSNQGVGSGGFGSFCEEEKPYASSYLLAGGYQPSSADWDA